jgi:putative hydrolase of the HAD superfamily
VHSADIRAVLFDVDGTLTDHDTAERAALLQHLGATGAVVPDADAAVREWQVLLDREYDRYLAGDLDFTGQRRVRAAAMLTWLGLPVPDRAGLDAWFAGYAAAYADTVALFDDVTKCLDALGGLPLGIVSNSDPELQRGKLGRAGILDRFRCLVCNGELGVAKPDAGIFRAACARLGYAPGEVLYVGDRLDVDARAAVAAGLTGVWLDRSDVGEEPSDVPRITDLGQLPALVGEVVR